MTKELKRNKGFIEKHGVVGSFSNIDTTKAPIGKALITNLSLDKNKTHFNKYELSELDIYNIKGVTELEARYMIKNFFKRSGNQKFFSKEDIETNEEPVSAEGIAYINKVVQDAIAFYERTLKRGIEQSFFAQRQKGTNESGPIFFKNTQDIINFIRTNAVSKGTVQNRQIVCSLLKISYAINIKNKIEEKLDKAEEIFDEISEKHIYDHFHDKNFQKIDADEMRGKCKRGKKGKYKTLITKGKPRISFRSSARIKDDDMIILKMISNPEYGDVDAINDIYGKKNECKSKEDVLFLMEYHREKIFKKDVENEEDDAIQIKIKNIFGKSSEENQAFFEKHKNELDPDFYTLLTNSVNTSKPGKNGDKYEDAKITGPLTDEHGEKHQVEIQFNLLNNKNESSFAHHRIYKMKAIVEAIVRLQGYIRKAQIDHIINTMLLEHKKIAEKEHLFPELLYLGGGKNENTTETAQNAIYTHFIENGIILPLNIPGLSENRTFTTKNQRNRFHEKDHKYLYPDGASVKRNNKRHHEKLAE